MKLGLMCECRGWTLFTHTSSSTGMYIFYFPSLRLSVNSSLSPGPQGTHTFPPKCLSIFPSAADTNQPWQPKTHCSFALFCLSFHLHSHLLSFCVPLFSSGLGVTLVMTCQPVTLKRLLHLYLSLLPLGSSYSRIRHLMQSQTENLSLCAVILGKL